MIVYVVSKVVDQIDDPSTTTVSVHVDERCAYDAAKAIDHRGLSGVYAVVETVKLDLTGLQSGQIFALENPV
jgi:hypothetical protein